MFLQVLALLNINFIFQNIKLRTIGIKTGGLIADLPFMPFVWIVAFRENYFVVNIRSEEMKLNGNWWLPVTYHLASQVWLKYTEPTQYWHQSDVPEPFTDTRPNLQTNNLQTSVEGQVLLFYLLNAWGKVVNFCFKMNCFCKLMLQFVHVEFLVSSKRVKNFAALPMSMNKVYLFIVYVFGAYTCQQMIHFVLKSKLIQLLWLPNFAYIMWQQSYNTQPICSLLYVCRLLRYFEQCNSS